MQTLTEIMGRLGELLAMPRFPPRELLEAAADEIERLRAESRRLRDELERRPPEDDPAKGWHDGR